MSELHWFTSSATGERAPTQVAETGRDELHGKRAKMIATSSRTLYRRCLFCNELALEFLDLLFEGLHLLIKLVIKW